MQILMLHNRYAIPGGEDVSTATEAAMLREAGHEVDLWQLSNDEIAGSNLLAVSANSIWSFPAARELSRRLTAKRYDVMHVQNYFPQFSPVVHRVAARHGVASVQHLRNFRFTCVNAGLFRDGEVCHDCVGSFVPWRGVQHSCYRGSRAGSAVAAAMIGVHKLAGTWTRSVTRYIAISEYVRDLHVQAGIPKNKIVVRANVVMSSLVAKEARRLDAFIASRLTPEKGVHVAIEAWKMAPRCGTLRIAGVGPQEAELRALAADDDSIVFLGQVASAEAVLEMARAHVVIVPPLWAEPFGRTALEAMAAGTPVFASNVGGLPEILGPSSMGLFPANAASALSEKLTSIFSNAQLWSQLKDEQANRYAAFFTPQALLSQTEQIYKNANASIRTA